MGWYPFHFQALQILDGFRRRCVTVLDQDTVDLDQAVVVWSGVPAKLFLERRSGFVVAFDGGDVGQVPSNGRMLSMSHLGGLKLGCTSMIRRAWRIGLSEGGGYPVLPPPQMQQNPHWAGFVLLLIWWAGVARLVTMIGSELPEAGIPAHALCELPSPMRAN